MVGRAWRKTTELWQSAFLRWLDKRQAPALQHRLHRQNLYIFPSTVGFAFLLLTLIIWLLGTNYQNNLILALSYLQISVFILTILNTYHNLAGLTLTAEGADAGFVGDRIAFHVQFASNNRAGTHYVTAFWQGESATILDFEPDQSHRERLYVTARRRGLLRPGRLCLQSTFPMGLLRCWTWLRLDMVTLVYPVPVACDLPDSQHSGDDSEQSLRSVQRGDEFSGLRAYVAGDSPKQVAWKQYARGQGLWSKQYGDTGSSQCWLDWQQFYRGDQELCLSHLCYWVLELERRQQPFGMRIPGFELPVADGPDHRDRALRALAEYSSEG